MSTGGEDQATQQGESQQGESQQGESQQGQAQQNADLFNVGSAMAQILDQIKMEPKQLPRVGRALFSLPTVAANCTNFTLSDPGIGEIINGITLGGSTASALQLTATFAQHEALFVFRNTAEGVLDNFTPMMNRALQTYSKHFRKVPDELMHLGTGPGTFESKAFEKFRKLVDMRKKDIGIHQAQALQSLSKDGVMSAQMVTERVRGNLIDMAADAVKEVRRDLKLEKVAIARPSTLTAFRLDVEAQADDVVKTIGSKIARYEAFQKVMHRTATGLGYVSILADTSAAVAKGFKAFETFQDLDRSEIDVAEDLVDSLGSSLAATGGAMMLRPHPFLFGTGMAMTITGTVLQTTPVKQAVAPVATQMFNTAKLFGSQTFDTARSVGKRTIFTFRTVGDQTFDAARSFGNRTVATAKLVGSSTVGAAKSVATTPSTIDFNGYHINNFNYSN